MTFSIPCVLLFMLIFFNFSHGLIVLVVFESASLWLKSYVKSQPCILANRIALALVPAGMWPGLSDLFDHLINPSNLLNSQALPMICPHEEEDPTIKEKGGSTSQSARLADFGR